MSQEISQGFERGLHPRVYAEAAQRQIDAKMPEIQEEVEMWNLRLQTEVDPEVIPQIARAAINSLDESWGLIGHQFLVSGTWRLPRASLSQRESIFEWGSENPSDALNIVPSYGFNVAYEDEKPMVGFAFKVGEVLLANAVVQGSLDFVAFADPQKVSLTYIAPPEIEIDTLAERAREALIYYDNILKLYLQDTRTGFYKSSRRKQQNFLEEVVRDTNESVTAIGFRLAASIASERIYVREVGGHGFRKVSATDENADLMVNGLFEGVAILDSETLEARPLRSPEEMIDPTGGAQHHTQNL